MSTAIDPAAVRDGRVRGRYFRENFAQGGFDLVQVVPELVTMPTRRSRRPAVAMGASCWRSGRPIPRSWPTGGVSCAVYACRASPSGSKRSAAPMTAKGWTPRSSSAVSARSASCRSRAANAGCSGVACATCGWRRAAVASRVCAAVAHWSRGSFRRPATTRSPTPTCATTRPSRCVAPSASMRAGRASRCRCPALGCRWRVGCATSWPTWCSCARYWRTRRASCGWSYRIARPSWSSSRHPSPTRSARSSSTTIKVSADVRARIVVRRAEHPITHTPQRALRRGGLLVRSGRAAHEVTLGSVENLPGAWHLYGEVLCGAIEEVQRAALDSPRPQLVVKADRSGLSEHHPLVQRLYAAIDEVLRPIVAAEERRAGAHLVQAARAIRARDEVGLRELNDALRTAFDAPGSAGFARGATPTRRAPATNGAPTALTRGRLRRLRGRSRSRQLPHRCASNRCWCGCIRASSGASRCSSTPRASCPAHRSRCSRTRGCASSCGRRSFRSRTRGAGRG